VRFLSRSRPLNSLFPLCQDLFHISFRALQRLKVCFDTLELFLRKLVNAAAGSASCITSFQDFSRSASVNPIRSALCTTSTLSNALAG